MLEHLSHFISHFSYAAIVLLLTSAGMGVPIPEEPVIIASGVLSANGTLTLWKAIVACYFGVMSGDYLIYRFGRKLGPRALEHRRLRRFFTPKRVEFIGSHFEKNGFLTIVVARHLSALRAPTFLFAGAAGLPPWKFLLADFLSGMVSVPVVALLAFHFATQLPELLHGLEVVKFVVLGVVVVGGTVGFLVWKRRHREPVATEEENAAALAQLREKLLHPAPHKPREV